MTQNLFWELQIVPKSRKHMVGNYKKQYWRKQRSLNLEKIFFFFKFSQNFIFCSPSTPKNSSRKFEFGKDLTQNLFWELQIVPKSRKHMVGNYKKQYWRKQRSLNLEKIFFFFKFSQNFIFCSQVHQRIHLENLNLAKIDPKLILRVANCSKVQKTHGWKLQKAILKKTALTKSWKNFLFF